MTSLLPVFPQNTTGWLSPNGLFIRTNEMLTNEHIWDNTARDEATIVLRSEQYASTMAFPKQPCVNMQKGP